VRQAIEDLDFRPNAGARILRRSDHRTATIGLLLEDVANPFSAAVQRAVEDVAVPRGVFVLSASLDEDADRERVLCRQFGARHVDGLVLAPAGEDQSHLAGSCGGARRSSASTGRRATCRSTRCRHQRRRRRGRGAAPRGRGSSAHRLPRRPADHPDRRPAARGLPRRARARGIAADPALVVQDIRDAGGSDGAVTALLSRPDPPTALFTAQNMITIGAVRAMRRLGLEHRVALVGFDDFLLAGAASPRASRGGAGPGGDGPHGRELLFDRIGGSTRPPECDWCRPP
jgi:LacI family transcriptional regulator